MNPVTNAAPQAARRTSLFHDPWAQAIITGALTLIPARNYPRWLRQSLIWGPPVIGGIGTSYLGVNPRARRKFLARIGASRSSHVQELAVQDELMPSRQPTRLAKGVRAGIAGVAAGAVVSGGMAFGLWADEQLERGLQRMKVPRPRAVMAVAVGAFTWWQVNQEQPHDK